MRYIHGTIRMNYHSCVVNISIISIAIIGVSSIRTTQKAQYPLIKEYTLNHTRIPNMVPGVFLNQGGIGLPGLKSSSLTLNPQP